MANADPSGWTAGKIILAVVGGCFLLTALCCTGTYLTNKDEFDEVFSIAGDAIAGDFVYSVILPGSLQDHRRLVRYRNRPATFR